MLDCSITIGRYTVELFPDDISVDSLPPCRPYPRVPEQQKKASFAQQQKNQPRTKQPKDSRADRYMKSFREEAHRLQAHLREFWKNAHRL